MAEAIVVDSSVWIEIFGQGALAKTCLKEVRGATRVGVPTVVLFEVYKKIASLQSEPQALSAISVLNQYEILDHTQEVALFAADIALQEKLAMADSLVLAHARSFSGTLLTLDNDFAGLNGARVIRRA